MKRFVYITILGAALAMPGAMTADDLNKEITVEKDIVPQEREASRLNRLPQLSLSPVQAKKLSWTDRAIAAPVTNDISVLAPASYAASIARSPYRGYIDLGYFPAMQLGLSAGYRFIDSDATRLGAWLQYDGSQYKRENVLGNKLSYRDHSGALGLSLTNDFEDIGTLKARLSYGMSTFNFPTLEDKGLSQSTNRVDFGLGWHSTLGAFSYNIGLDYNYFGFSKAVNDELPGLKALNENTARLSLGGLYSFDEFNNVGLDLTGAVNGVNDFAGIGSHTFAYIQASPYYLNRGKNYSVRLGIEFDYIKGLENKTRIYPDVRLDWSPSSSFALYARFYGGNPNLNSASELFDQNHYINPSMSFGPSWDKYTGRLGFIVGPFAGASFEIWGGYGKVSSLPLPALVDENTSISAMGYYATFNMTSVNYGIAFNYTYRDLAKLRLSYEGAPQDIDKGYALWLDRARNVFDATVTVTPVKALDLELAYRLRSGRSVYALDLSEENPFDHIAYTKVGLGNAGSLDCGAAYRITPQFSVWARGENLLNGKWQEVYGIPNKGITGLIGIGYKF